jgi:hypothetical protein
MRYVTLTKLGTPSCEGSEITIPYSGDEFTFLSPEWRALARKAACAPDSFLREGNAVAHVFDCEITQ